MPSIQLKTLGIAFIISLGLLIPFEYYWGHVKHWPKSYDSQDLDLWAELRAQVDDLDSTDVIIMGSSRGHYDINIHLWDSITGTRPLMLAYPGSSPFYPIEDIVEKSDFNGLLIISTAPGLFYTLGDSWGAGRGKAFVDHYYDRTYAQRLNHFIYKQIDPLFHYSDPELSIKALVNRLPFPNRDSVKSPNIWPPMVKVDKYRNVRMISQMETDTVLQRKQTDIWFSPNRKNPYPDSIDLVIGHYSSLVNKFQDKGGRVAYIRPPVSGFYLEYEPVEYPRDKYWDRLLNESNCSGFHYTDHPDTKDMIPPEWSHLNKRDADIYTKTIINLLRQEGLL